MQSFRSEIENPLVEKDIIELEKKIRLYREGKLQEDKFKSLRLARGVYGQRQLGVQMVRIKLPFGRMTTQQLTRIAAISDEYSTGNLHLTTRQDIQIHYVSLDRTPELWANLEKDDVTLREACGNTVRNVTASPEAGIDPEEPFDVSPYADATFRYFLRNPICQDMGRKFKMSFSSSDADTAMSYMHDLGFIPKVKEENGQTVRGFKVMIGGGLGAQPALAHTAYEFLPEDKVIPLIEGVLRIFDRHGERNNRNKARFKYLIAKLGLEEVMRLVNEEYKALKSHAFEVDKNADFRPALPAAGEIPDFVIEDTDKYNKWLKTNVFQQKQEGYYGVYIKVLTGDISSDTARALVPLVRGYAADDIRVTQGQNLLLKFVREEVLPYFFARLDELGLAEPGFNSVADITTCPGTDTCNLGISNSVTAAKVLEEVIVKEYPELLFNRDIKIKMSGCMNSCGQHGMANLGFHGSSLKSGKSVIPALQVLLGGGTVVNGEGRIAQKVLKVPSKRGPEVVRSVINDYQANKQENERFNEYYDRNGKDYFYQLLKPLADLTTLTADDFVDWGHQEQFETAIGVGECAGVMIDLVATLLYESDEKLEWAAEALQEQRYADAIYYGYASYVSTAKALLLDKDVKCNTHAGIIHDFDTHFVAEGVFNFSPDFKSEVLQINQNEPGEAFAKDYLNRALVFLQEATRYRQEQRQKPAFEAL
ncbi:sulfite reductase (ferredoxin) [Pontibacter ummariensis]|uniref:Sulfite reductase (Ferredoxin) n=1 Tax=Pontibacter ummariensis TaxID=1610492 RepID=A0A239IPX2_9BACT|nr:HEPN domain-containing protein [Pontibacter ummariensis]PRY09699.1 sulfite reductase (ferredoxin) [Pontibacter ummariensis]SNS95710.1 sulfite reductase (ferredoxin) [Pontibacter ummariensis]